ncbi:MAG: hypothetical protein PVH29_14505 [Candidatus Zixiibacteriota bacterium]|jgi:hypothetical protein
MPYCDIDDVRAEGVDSSSADDARVSFLIDLSTRYIDRVTGQFFESRRRTHTLDGPGVDTLFFRVPIVDLVRVVVDDTTAADLAAFVADERRLIRRGAAFPRGRGNVVVEADFGFLEDGATPALIKRVCVLLVIRSVPKAATEEAADARRQGMIVEEKIRDYSYKLSDLAQSGGPTGDPEIDGILEMYAAPPAIGAV